MRSAFILGLVALAGCASSPAYRSPALRVPTSFRECRTRRAARRMWPSRRLAMRLSRRSRTTVGLLGAARRYDAESLDRGSCTRQPGRAGGRGSCTRDALGARAHPARPDAGYATLWELCQAAALQRELPGLCRVVPGSKRLGRGRVGVVGPGRIRADPPNRAGAGRHGGGAQEGCATCRSPSPLSWR